jgi:2-oxoglutarate dehydrogenase E2 component (dihydrolipoamide succinyltransferase)
MSFFIKACVEVLKEIPEINSEIYEDKIIYKNYFDIGVAIGSEKGLVVPIIRDVEKLSNAEIEKK